jgi:hypothetical protein
VKADEAWMRARVRELVEVESPSEDKAAVDRAGGSGVGCMVAIAQPMHDGAVHEWDTRPLQSLC